MMTRLAPKAPALPQARPAVQFGNYAYAYNEPQKPVYIDWTSAASKQNEQLRHSVDHLATVVEKGFQALIQAMAPVNPPHKDM
jgi:hypothetical protein